MKLITNGDLLEFGDTLYIAAEDCIGQVLGSKEKILYKFEKIITILNDPFNFDIIETYKTDSEIRNSCGNKKIFIEGKGWTYKSNGRKVSKLNRPEISDIIKIGSIGTCVYKICDEHKRSVYDIYVPVIARYSSDYKWVLDFQYVKSIYVGDLNY